MGDIKNLWWAKGLPHPTAGTKMSDETKAKLREARSKQIIPMTEETKAKIKKALLKKSEYFSNLYKGEKSSFWKGGLTDENTIIRRGFEFKRWRTSVFERDNYTCQRCLKRGTILHPHHIENFSSNIEKRFDIENGITLCKLCHRKFHKRYGIKNNNRIQITKFARLGR